MDTVKVVELFCLYTPVRLVLAKPVKLALVWMAIIVAGPWLPSVGGQSYARWQSVVSLAGWSVGLRRVSAAGSPQLGPQRSTLRAEAGWEETDAEWTVPARDATRVMPRDGGEGINELPFPSAYYCFCGAWRPAPRQLEMATDRQTPSNWPRRPVGTGWDQSRTADPRYPVFSIERRCTDIQRWLVPTDCRVSWLCLARSLAGVSQP